MVTFICATVEDSDDREYILWIYEEFKNLMFFTAKKYINDQTTCEDIVQDCIIKLIQKIDVIRGKERCILAGYIVSMIRNISINHLRHEGIIREHITVLEQDEIHDISSKRLSLEDSLLGKEKAALLLKALEQLPKTEYLLLQGKYILEYNDDELAEQLGCKVSSIRMKLTRARRHAFSVLSQTDWEGEGDDEQARTITGKV